jgi:hypothetical protein
MRPSGVFPTKTAGNHKLSAPLPDYVLVGSFGRETMKAPLLIAFTILGVVGIGSAYAGDGGGPAADTYFTELPGVVAHPPGQVPDYSGLPHGQATQGYANRFPWLPAPAGRNGVNG